MPITGRIKKHHRIIFSVTLTGQGMILRLKLNYRNRSRSCRRPRRASVEHNFIRLQRLFSIEQVNEIKLLLGNGNGDHDLVGELLVKYFGIQ